jgi:hypothetical protein
LSSWLNARKAVFATLGKVGLGRETFPPVFTDRASRFGVVILVTINASITAAASLRFGFTQDDLQNTYWALHRGWLQLVGDIFSVWKVSPVYRPTTELCLKLFYTCVGMKVAAWRAGYAFLIVLLALSFLAMAWRITGSPLAGGIAGLLSAYHVNARLFYFATGRIFDMLGVIAVVSFFLFYVAARSRGWKWGFAAVLAFCIVLGVKEIAIDALIFVAIYELVEDPSLFSRPLRWFGRRKRLLVLAAIAAAFCLSQVFDPNSLSHMPAYQITLSWAAYREHVQYLLDEVVTQPVAAWQALLVITLASLRSVRICVWSVICFLAGILPIAFIPQRGLDAAAVPMIALAVLVGVAVETVCVAAAAFTSKRLGFVLASATFVVILLVQGSATSRGAEIEFPPQDTVIATAFQALDHLSPPPAGNAHIVVDSDPFGSFPWADVFLFCLYYGNPRLDVRRPEQVLPEHARALHWLHIRWVNGRWEWASGPGKSTGAQAAAHLHPGVYGRRG